MHTGIGRFIFVAATIAIGLTLATVFAQSSSKGMAQTGARYLPEYTASGDLVRRRTSTNGCTVPSGNSKDSKRYADTGGWGYYYPLLDKWLRNIDVA
jgi:hypothetical protein